MTLPIRHQCLIYEGSPALQLPSLVEAIRHKLAEGYRCLYLNSPPMIAGIRSYLSAAGVSVSQEVEKGRLVLSSDRAHLVDGRFDAGLILNLLADALAQSLRDGFTGLFATGDMTWELGSIGDNSSLLDYEWRLEEFFRHNPALCGICQYHVDTLPTSIMREGLVSHPALFVNETLLRVNAHYVPPEVFTTATLQNHTLDTAIAQLCQDRARKIVM